MINVSICTSVLLLISKNVGRIEKITKKPNYVLKRNKKKTGGGPEETIPTNEAIDQFLTTITDIEVHGVLDSDSLRNMSSSTPNNFETILQGNYTI